MAEYPLQELKNRITDQFHENHEHQITGEILQEALHDIIDSVSFDVQTTQSNDKYYRHDQGTPASVWTISHGLNKIPAIMVFDSAGTEVVGSIQIIDNDNITITFTAAFSGIATCN